MTKGIADEAIHQDITKSTETVIRCLEYGGCVGIYSHETRYLQVYQQK